MYDKTFVLGFVCVVNQCYVVVVDIYFSFDAFSDLFSFNNNNNFYRYLIVAIYPYIHYTQMHHCFRFCIKMFFISNNNNSITESKQRRMCARQLYKRQFCVVVIINIIAEVHYYYKRGMRGDNNKIENIIHINFIKRKIIINFRIIFVYKFHIGN